MEEKKITEEDFYAIDEAAGEAPRDITDGYVPSPDDIETKGAFIRRHPGLAAPLLCFGASDPRGRSGVEPTKEYAESVSACRKALYQIADAISEVPNDAGKES